MTADTTAANQAIAIHVESATSNRCAACDQHSPCASRTAAEATLQAHGLLPRRTPGATARTAGVTFTAEPPNATPPQTAPRTSDWFTPSYPHLPAD